MVIAPLLDQQGLNLAVPNMIEVQDEVKDSKLLKVLVTNDDRYMYDGEEIGVNELSEFISQKKNDCPDGLLIMTEENSTHGSVVKLMDEARNVGVTSISITEA